MSNVSKRSLRIHPGVRLCQLVLLRTEGEAVYRGPLRGPGDALAPCAPSSSASPARASRWAAEEVAAHGRGPARAGRRRPRDDTRRGARELARRIVHLRVFADAAGAHEPLAARDGRHARAWSRSSRSSATRARVAGRASAKRRRPRRRRRSSRRWRRRRARSGCPVVCGRFGARMDVELVNAGPVTLLLDTDRHLLIGVLDAPERERHHAARGEAFWRGAAIGRVRRDPRV